MNNLPSLIKTALVGTAKSAFQPSDPEELVRLGISSELSTEEQLLRLSIAYSRLRRSGFIPLERKGKTPSPCPVETLKSCSSKSALLLKNVLFNKQNLGIKEFLFHLAQAKRHIPFDMLPDLLEKGIHKEDWHPLLKATMGERGAWLVAQNPAWSYLSEPTDESIWELGKREERVFYLQHLRANDPQAALEKLTATWAEDSSDDKLKFIPILAKHISEKDEDLLEKALQSRRQEVRLAAAKLLPLIEQSQFNQRMQARLKACILVKKALLSSSKLEIKLPVFDEGMKKDGMVKNEKGGRGGQKANWLKQMIATQPPSFWSAYLGAKPPQVIRLFANTDWKFILLNALIEASAKHQNADYLSALLEFWVLNINNEDIQQLEFNQIFSYLVEPVFQKIAIKALKKGRNILDDQNSVTQLLLHSPNPWSDEMTLEVFAQFEGWLSTSGSNFWSKRHFKDVLKVAAYRVNPKMVGRLSKTLLQNGSTWGSWERELDEFIRTLQLREQMVLELYKD